MRSLRIVCFLCLACSIYYLAGCGGISSIKKTQKDLISKEDRLTAYYRYTMFAPTNLFSMSHQAKLWLMVNELMGSEMEALDQAKGKYILIIKVLEYKKIDIMGRFNTGMFAGTDHISTQITIVDSEAIVDKNFFDLLSKIQDMNKYIDPDNPAADKIKDMADLAKTHLGMPETHVFQGVLETNHKSPEWIEDTEFLRIHAMEVVNFIFED